MEELLKWHSDYTGDKSHIFLATKTCASGILEAMEHFNLQPNMSPRDRPPSYLTVEGAAGISVSTVAHEVVEYLLQMEKWLNADVDNTDLAFSRLKSSLVRPLIQPEFEALKFPSWLLMLFRGMMMLHRLMMPATCMRMESSPILLRRSIPCVRSMV